VTVRHASVPEPARSNSGGQPGGMRALQVLLGPSAQFSPGSFTISADVSDTSPGGPLIGCLPSGRLLYSSVGSQQSRGASDTFLAIQSRQPHLARSFDAGTDVTLISSALLNRLASAGPPQARPPVRFTGFEPISARAADIWKATYAYVRDSVLMNPGAGTQALVVSSAARLLAATTLAAFPNNATTDPSPEDRHGTHPATLHRATVFIDEHAHADITAADIADAAHVTIRAVQLTFRRYLDMTPMQYLRRVRLDHARRDLLTADPARTTVTAVAYRWGFASPGRFAMQYRDAYGVSPSHTLQD
jgi:AraC-like DNA-binding protein